MIKPTFSYVLLSKVTAEKSKGGIILPEMNDVDDTIIQGKVEAIGPNCSHNKVGYVVWKVGDEVLFSVLDSKETTYDGQKFHLVKEEDILAVV